MTPRRILAAAIVAALLGAAPARAADNLEVELAKVAQDIARLLQGEDEETVTVGQFTGPARLASSAGPSIQKTLADQLTKLKVRVTRRANLEIKGDYLDVEDRQTGKLAAMLKWRVLDRTGKVLSEDQRGIFGDATLASLFGLTTELPPRGDADERDQKLKDAIDKPKTAIQETRISAGKESPFAIEVAIKEGETFIPRAPTVDDGLAFVPIKRGEAYQVRLVNHADFDAAVTLTIDGLNMFSFSDVKDDSGRPKYSQVIVPAGKTGLISGWHRTNEVSDSFLVTEFARSAAAELKSDGDIGTITASFSAAWPTNGQPPGDEPPTPPSRFSRSADATGRGPQVGAEYKEVERQFGVVRASISARYTK
jgi:hypothetical protein